MSKRGNPIRQVVTFWAGKYLIRLLDFFVSLGFYDNRSNLIRSALRNEFLKMKDLLSSEGSEQFLTLYEGYEEKVLGEEVGY